MLIGSLFSGGGLGDLGFYLAGYEIAWQVEIDSYCQKILKLRWPNVQKYEDIREVKDVEPVELITGGFPCQPFSYAGDRRGDKDDRHLWPEMLRVIRQVRPTWVVAENVLGIVNLALDGVLSDLENEGYETIPLVFSAHAQGAPHKRERVWIVAYAGHDAGGSKFKRKQKMWAQEFGASCQRDVANPSNSRVEGLCEGENSIFSEYWKIEPGVGRMVNECSDRMDRIRMLGNGQVTSATYFIGRKILQFEKGG